MLQIREYNPEISLGAFENSDHILAGFIPRGLGPVMQKVLHASLMLLFEMESGEGSSPLSFYYYRKVNYLALVLCGAKMLPLSMAMALLAGDSAIHSIGQLVT